MPLFFDSPSVGPERWELIDSFLKYVADKVRLKLDSGAYFYDLASFRADMERHGIPLNIQATSESWNLYELAWKPFFKHEVLVADRRHVRAWNEDAWNEFMSQCTGWIGSHQNVRGHSHYWFSETSDATLFKLTFC